MKFLWSRFVAWVRDWATLPAQLREAEKRLDLQRKLNVNLVNNINARARECEVMAYELALLREDRDPPLMPGLTAAEIERLAMLAEECGEVAQAVGKVLRHGWHSCSPYNPRVNRMSLEREIGDLRAVIELMLDTRDLRLSELQAWQRRKRSAMPKWTHHQGTL